MLKNLPSLRARVLHRCRSDVRPIFQNPADYAVKTTIGYGGYAGTAPIRPYILTAPSIRSE